MGRASSVRRARVRGYSQQSIVGGGARRKRSYQRLTGTSFSLKKLSDSLRHNVISSSALKSSFTKQNKCLLKWPAHQNSAKAEENKLNVSAIAHATALRSERNPPHHYEAWPVPHLSPLRQRKCMASKNFDRKKSHTGE